MLAYAAHRRTLAARGQSPNAMLVIVAAHVAGLAALMSARPDIVPTPRFVTTVVDLITEDDPPPPLDLPRDPPKPAQRTAATIVPVPDSRVPAFEPAPADPLPMPGLGPSVDSTPGPAPRIDPVLPVDPVRIGARLLTSGEALRPPYPASKIASGEETVLKLRLEIAPDGRVVSVEPVGAADATFLASARRHILMRWRYRPATQDGRAVAASITVTVRFQLES